MNRKRVLPYLLICVFCLAFGAALPSLAQNQPDVVPQATTGWGGSELRVVAGYSPRSNHLIGITPNRKLYFTAIEYQHPLFHFWGTTVSYYGGIVPFVGVHRPAESVNGVPYKAGLSWGPGAEPIGFAFGFLSGARIQPILETAGGLAYFNEDVPIAQSSQFNFMFHFGGGLEFYRDGGHFLTVGYRYHHISNANLGHFNPGIDSNLIYIAVPLWRRIKTH
jgi:hypothetical protein